MSGSIVRRSVESKSSEETSEEDFESIKNDLAKLLTEEQNKQLDSILDQFNSNVTTLEQKVGGLVWTFCYSVEIKINFMNFLPNSQVQILELGLSAATANVGKAVSSNNEQTMSENKV